MVDLQLLAIIYFVLDIKLTIYSVLNKWIFFASTTKRKHTSRGSISL